MRPVMIVGAVLAIALASMLSLVLTLGLHKISTNDSLSRDLPIYRVITPRAEKIAAWCAEIRNHN